MVIKKEKAVEKKKFSIWPIIFALDILIILGLFGLGTYTYYYALLGYSQGVSAFFTGMMSGMMALFLMILYLLKPKIKKW